MSITGMSMTGMSMTGMCMTGMCMAGMCMTGIYLMRMSEMAIVLLRRSSLWVSMSAVRMWRVFHLVIGLM